MVAAEPHARTGAHRVARRLRQLEAQEVDRTVAAEKKKVALQKAELAKLKARK